MASNVDPSVPTEVKAYTADVRNNFATVKSEIEALQDILGASAVAVMRTASDPPGITSTSYVMMGMDVSFTPIRASRMLATINGQIQNSSQGQATSAIICMGAGAPPVFGAPQAGSTLGTSANFEAASNSSPFVPFSLTVLTSSLLANTAYWIGLAVKVTGGTGIVSNINITAVEIL